MLLNADPKSCAGLLGHHPNRLLTLGDKACAEGGLQATQALDSRIQGGKNGVSRRLRHGSGPTCGFVPHPQVGPGATVGTLRQEYSLLQDKDEGAQEWQPRSTGPNSRGQVPNLRGPDLGLYNWKPDLQEA